MIVSTLSGKVIRPPKRIKTRTGRVMVVATILASSDTRSDYPLRVIGFEVQALALMIYQRGQIVTVTGKTGYRGGYQITLTEII